MRTSILLLVLSVMACHSTDDGALRSDDDEGLAETAPGAPAPAPAPDRWLPLAASGWIDHEDSPITPWCGVVLIAPDVVVTAARCLGGYDRRDFAVGFGAVGSKHLEIDEALEQQDARNPDHALVALRLAGPVDGIEPVSLDLRRDGPCDVESVGYRYAPRGDASARWVWGGCLDSGTLIASAGEPNCHGDMGTGAFLADGALVGVAIDIWSEGGCAKGHLLATVTDNESFFDSALELSRPPA